MSLSAFFSTVEKDVEIAAADILKVFAKASTEVATVAAKEPAAVAALGVVMAAVAKAVEDASSAASSGGLNISLDASVVTDIKAVWPSVQALLASLGITIK